MIEEKILIIDDNPSSLEKTKDCLSKVGYKIFFADSGKSALRFLEKERVDLVLLDINMPEQNGFEICLQIRQQYALDDLPIIFLTGREDFESITRGFHAGASDFISKASIAEILLARVNVHIRLARTLHFLRDISLTDDLTKSYNRRHAIYTLKEWFARSKRYGTPFSMIYLDVNGLKQINDKYGHQAGDMLLRTITQAIKDLLRESDMLFRMGGDEFMVLCPDTNKQGTLICVDRMQEAVKKLTIVDKQVSFSYGIAHSTDSFKNMDEMLNFADKQMYAQKKLIKKAAIHKKTK